MERDTKLSFMSGPRGIAMWRPKVSELVSQDILHSIYVKAIVLKTSTVLHTFVKEPGLSAVQVRGKETCRAC